MKTDKLAAQNQSQRQQWMSALATSRFRAIDRSYGKPNLLSLTIN